jgi:hypothetical protein
MNKRNIEINVITPCTRTNDLQKIYNSIPFDTFQNIKWYIVFDSEKLEMLPFDTLSFLQNSSNIVYSFCKNNSIPNVKNDSGRIRSYILDIIRSKNRNAEQFVCCMDDDNIMYPNYIKRIMENLENTNYQGIIYHQSFRNNRIRLEASPSNVMPSKIDAAQYIININLTKGVKWGNGSRDDGIFIQDVYTKNQDKFIFLNEVLCYYNYLRS